MVIFAVGTVEWFGAVSHVVVGEATVWASLAVSTDSFCVTNLLHFFASVRGCGLFLLPPRSISLGGGPLNSKATVVYFDFTVPFKIGNLCTCLTL